MLPEVVVYFDRNFGGPEWRTNLSYSYVGDYWNDQISSIIVVSGTWRFFEDSQTGAPVGGHWDLGPGWYSWVEDLGIPNDTISAFEAIAF